MFNSSNEIEVVYGGSVNEKNAHDILSKPNIDGVLVGGVSLNPETFFSIIESANNI
ncbi:hypothetical protein FACS189496_3110 [Bacilli bacterium]|nr:hypothetical protein FACS189496_3110 [Bacilli bacterium]